MKSMIVTLGFPSRRVINAFLYDRIKKSIIAKKDIVNIYTKHTKNEKVTKVILKNALEKGIPVNLFFALAKIESDFTIKALSKKNRNGSFDIGLFQLNSNVYKKYSLKKLLTATFNADLSAKHLAYNYKRYGNWNEAIIAYNCGNIKSVPQQTIKYLSRILLYETKLNEELYRRFK